MDNNINPVVFFDIGNTLGTPIISPLPQRLEGVKIYPYIKYVLEKLKDNKIRLGIISNTSNETADNMNRVLEEAGIFHFFEPELLIYSSVVGLNKDSSEIFDLAAGRAENSNSPENCLFVGEDSIERSFAEESGWRISPHPILVWDILNGENIRYIRVNVPANQNHQQWRSQILQLSVVPIHVTGELGTKVYAISSDSSVIKLDDLGGVIPLNEDSEYKIKSRHIHHPDITLVTETLAKDLQKIGDGSFSLRMDRFIHEGKILDNVEAELKGSDSNEIVLVTAHLDSTAAFSDHEYDPETDTSPGADDDASGVAAVLAIANTIKQIAEVAPPKRTIRFVLFNAEEHGLVGSKAYARNQAALSAPIVAVYQMDMIGYNVKPPRSFEVHVGYSPAPEVEARSLVLAERINRLLPELSPNLQLPQIYTQPDPAEGRSDHASFHDYGYAACTTSEDFFAGLQPGSPTEEPNPNYHKDKDTFVDFEYASDITRVVAGAVIVTANLTNNNQGIQIMTNQWQQSSEKIGRVAALAAKISDIPVGVDPPLLGSRMRIWKQDPSVQGLQVPRTVYIHGQVASGPSDSQLEIKGLPPVSPDFKQDFLFDPANDEEAFDAVHTYTIVRQAVTMYQRVLGRKLQWAWNNGSNQEAIEVHPRAGVDENAYYSRAEQALKFFFFTPRTSPGSRDRVFTCRSLDIVAHEAGHAILDGLKPGWIESFALQTGGLHEAFGDLTSIFLILSQLDLVEYIIAETKSDLHQKTILSALAEQFGIGLGRPPALRNADNNLKLSEVRSQVHAISVVFTGGIYDILADVFASNRDPRKRSDAEVLYESGQYMASLTIRAIINSPDTNATYADVVNAMISLANSDGHPDYVSFIKKHFEFREVIGGSAFNDVVDLSQLGLFSNRCGCCGTLQSPEYLK